jgi:hypothetical protein
MMPGDYGREDQGRDDQAPAWQCAGCGQWNSTSVDSSAGRRQSYVEDCQVCCRPSVLTVEYDPETGDYLIRSELE